MTSLIRRPAGLHYMSKPRLGYDLRDIFILSGLDMFLLILFIYTATTHVPIPNT